MPLFCKYVARMGFSVSSQHLVKQINRLFTESYAALLDTPEFHTVYIILLINLQIVLQLNSNLRQIILWLCCLHHTRYQIVFRFLFCSLFYLLFVHPLHQNVINEQHKCGHDANINIKHSRPFRSNYMTAIYAVMS